MKKGEKAVRTLRPQSTWKQKLASTRRMEAEAVTPRVRLRVKGGDP